MIPSRSNFDVPSSLSFHLYLHPAAYCLLMDRMIPTGLHPACVAGLKLVSKPLPCHRRGLSRHKAILEVPLQLKRSMLYNWLSGLGIARVTLWT